VWSEATGFTLHQQRARLARRAACFRRKNDFENTIYPSGSERSDKEK
jgi:hypothetical protein